MLRLAEADLVRHAIADCRACEFELSAWPSSIVTSPLTSIPFSQQRDLAPAEA